MTPCNRFSGNESAHARQRAARARDSPAPYVQVVGLLGQLSAEPLAFFPTQICHGHSSCTICNLRVRYRITASSPISQKFLDQLTTLASQRNQRILDAKPRIPGLLWTGLLFGGVLLLGLGGFMCLGSVRAHLLLLSAVAVLLGLLLFIVYWLDHPFGNQLGVTSEPFEQSLSVFDSIDRGT